MEGGSQRGSSRLAEVGVTPPALDKLVTTDGKKPVDGMRLTVSPVDASCPNGTSIDQILPTANSLKIQKKVAKGCAYDLRIEFGKMDASNPGATSLKEIYYSTPTATRITADMTKDDKINARVAMQITDAGKAIGLPASLSDQQPTPTPDPGPQPQSLTDLPAKLSVSLDGPSGPVAFKDIFKTQYMILDFSQVGCFYCTELAKKNDQDADFQRLITGSKCRAATILPNGQVNDWIEAIGGSGTHGAKESFSYSGGLNGFGKLFGITVPTTPTVIIVDRDGQILDKKVGAMPGQISKLCGN
jgi:hypothetical protein